MNEKIIEEIKESTIITEDKDTEEVTVTKSKY